MYCYLPDSGRHVTRQYQGLFSAGGHAPSIRENSLGTRLDSGDEWQASSKRKPHNDSKETSDAERRTRNQEKQPPRNKISTKDTKYKDFLT